MCVVILFVYFVVFFFKQKTAYEMRISDWSSDVCSSDLERNNAAVWVSTYTRNLQGQVDDELARLFPEPRERARKVVIRKGRENYLCLLNFAEAVAQARPQDAVALGLIARWAARPRGGDMVGGDFPGGRADLFGPL